MILGMIVTMTLREMNLTHKSVPDKDSFGRKLAETFRTPMK
jgi:hypothetical protein